MFKDPDLTKLGEALADIEIAARVRAEPGWYVVVTVPTKLKDASDPDTKYGKEIYKLLVYEIQEWGLPNPMMRPRAEPEKLDFLGLLGLGELEVTEDLLKNTLRKLPSWLPIDPSDPSKFLTPLHIAAIYSPREADSAQAALKLGQAEMLAATERVVAERRKRDEGRSSGDLFPNLFKGDVVADEGG